MENPTRHHRQPNSVSYCHYYPTASQNVAESFPNKEESMLSKPPVRFSFDIVTTTSTVSSNTFDNSRGVEPEPTTKHFPGKRFISDGSTGTHNPTYFQETAMGPSESGLDQRPLSSSTRSSPPIPPVRPRYFRVPQPPVPLHRFQMYSEDVIEEQEIDVFLEPFDSSSALPKKCEKKSSNPLGKLTSFLWKSRNSKPSSVGSGSASSGIGSPPFTPDSSLSIYTNSIDSDSHSSNNSQPSTSNSDQGHYPEVHFHRPLVGTGHDLDHVRAPLYTNVQPVGRFRNHSLPSPNRQYYNARNFETFRCASIRRHSISAGPTSPLPADLDSVDATVPTTSPATASASGYLVPIQTRSQGTGRYKNVGVDSHPQNTTVRVEVHTPSSSQGYSDMFWDSSASTAIPQTVYTAGRRAVMAKQPCSSDSSSTIEAVPAVASEESLVTKAEPQVLTAKFRREFNKNGTDCEAYCKFCSTTSLPMVAQPRSTTKMNVGILYCQGCFFSKSAVGQIVQIFETMVGPDRNKIHVNIQTYDIQEIGENVQGAELHRAKIQIVVISQSFLDHLRHASSVHKKVSPINRILRTKRVIGILLSGVLPHGSTNSKRNDVGDGFQQYLLEFSNWETIELKPSSKVESEFYSEFTSKVVGIYTAEQRPPAGFSIFPKKVTKHQTKVVIFFKNPIENGDRVSVRLGRGRRKEFVQEVVLVNPYSGIIQMPTSLFEDDRSVLIEISVTLNGGPLGVKALKYDHHSHLWEDDVLEEEPVEHSDETVTPISPAGPEYYDMPRPVKQDYCVPPSPRPVVPKKPIRVTPPMIKEITETLKNSSLGDNDANNVIAESTIEYANIVNATESSL